MTGIPLDEIPRETVMKMFFDGLPSLFNGGGSVADAERTFGYFLHLNRTDGWTGEQLRVLYPAVSDYYSRYGGFTGSAAFGKDFLDDLMMLLGDDLTLDVSFVGTCWRLLAHLSTRHAGRHARGFLRGGLYHYCVPVELLAAERYRYLRDGDDQSTVLALARIVESYPDLAGLPTDLALQTVASFPISDEQWFVDAFPLPAEAKAAQPLDLVRSEVTV